MTVGLCGVKWRCLAQGVSPSPNPLPLGEGFSLGGGLGFVAIGRGFVMRGKGARPCAPTIGGNQRHRQPSYPIRPPGAGPLPAGEGWVREKRPAPPNPDSNPNSRLIPSFPPSTVIPAKAGIHTRPIAMPTPTGVLDSGLRRNDGGGRKPRKSPPLAKGGLGGFPHRRHYRGAGFRPAPE